MKYIRWVLWISLLICFVGSLRRQPFFEELPILLLPERRSDVLLRKNIPSFFDEVLDPRPICIQTKNNFAYFSNQKDLEESYIISRLKSLLSSNSTDLLSDKVITIPQKELSLETTPVWATKHIKPLCIAKEKIPKPIFDLRRQNLVKQGHL